MSPELIAISERIRDHLTKQKAVCSVVNEQGSTSCRYRGENGRMCAVGCLISNEHYTGYLEGMGVMSGPEVRDAVYKSLNYRPVGRAEEEKYERLFQAWQIYHDSYEDYTGFSYGVWLEDQEEPISPSDFHDYLVETL